MGPYRGKEGHGKDRWGTRRSENLGHGGDAGERRRHHHRLLAVEHRGAALIWLAIVLANGVGVYAMFSPQAAYFSELFDPRVSYSGIALAREISAPFAGGIAPFIAAFLLSRTGSYWPIAVYMMVLALITVVAVYLGPETYRRSTPEEEVMEGATVGPQTTSPA